MYNSPDFYLYQNPAFYSSYIPNSTTKLSLFSKLKGGINWNNLLNNTSRTLNLINQAIPLYYQVRPLIRNASTLFKIADIIKMDDNKDINSNSQTTTVQKKEDSNLSSGPTFFL